VGFEKGYCGEEFAFTGSIHRDFRKENAFESLGGGGDIPAPLHLKEVWSREIFRRQGGSRKDVLLLS